MCPAPARRTQAERRASPSAALLHATAGLIAELGPDRASLRNIGARAGTSRAMPSYHFGSKEALIGALVRQGNSRTLAATTSALEQANADLDDLPALDALCRIIENFLAVVTRSDTPEERAVVVLWGASFPSQSEAAEIRQSDRDT